VPLIEIVLFFSDEPETRDAWWIELRTEIRSHARAMGCHAVIGYSEETTICDEIIVLSACGTAALVNLHLTIPAPLTLSLDRQQFEKEKDKRLHVDINLANQIAFGQEVINRYIELKHKTAQKDIYQFSTKNQVTLFFVTDVSSCFYDLINIKSNSTLEDLVANERMQ
jgi:hypothetical protein